jgi:hypothetical protein
MVAEGVDREDAARQGSGEQEDEGRDAHRAGHRQRARPA